MILEPEPYPSDRSSKRLLNNFLTSYCSTHSALVPPKRTADRSNIIPSLFLSRRRTRATIMKSSTASNTRRLGTGTLVLGCHLCCRHTQSRRSTFTVIATSDTPSTSPLSAVRASHTLSFVFFVFIDAAPSCARFTLSQPARWVSLPSRTDYYIAS